MEYLKMKLIYFLSMVFFLSFSVALSAADLATVGKKKITDSELKSKLGALPPVQKSFLNKNVSARTRLVENVVMEELFMQQALKSGLDKSGKFKKALENRRTELLARAYVTEVIDKKLNDSGIKSYFNRNKIRYRTDQVRAFHILVKTKAAADEVYAKAVKATDDNFKSLAKKHSTDPSAARNLGDLGYFTRARMVPEFSAVAFKLKKGQTAKPLKTNFGWHVIRVVDKKPGKSPSFSSVKDEVKDHYRQNLLEQITAKLKKQNGVKMNTANIQKLQF